VKVENDEDEERDGEERREVLEKKEKSSDIYCVRFLS